MKTQKKQFIQSIFIITLAFALSILSFSQESLKDGESYYTFYCSRCHGDVDRISGDIAYYSKNTLMLRYKNRSKQLLNRLIYVEKFIKSPSMIQAVHKINDKTVIIKIVNYLSDPDLPLPDSEKIEREKERGL